MSLTTRPISTQQPAESRYSVFELPQQPRNAFVEEASESPEEDTAGPHAPYDPSFAREPAVKTHLSHDFASRSPQTEPSSHLPWTPGPWADWGSRDYSNLYSEGAYGGYRAHYQNHPAPWGGVGQPHSQRNSYQPPQGPSEFFDRRVPAEEIPVDRDPEKLVPFADLWQTEANEGELSTWLQPKSCPAENTECELLAIKTLENGPDEAGHTGTTLICDNGPPRWDTDTEPQIRWLHVKQSTLSFADLEHLVSTCPFIRFDLMKVALRLLKHLSENVSSIQEGSLRLELGTGLCYVGRYIETVGVGDSQRTEPVIFLACPFLDIAKLESAHPQGDHTRKIGPQSLLNTLYGYDVGIEREKQQIVQKMAADSSDSSSLEVRQTWVLRLGNDVLITVSHQGSKSLLGENLRVDDGKSKVEGKISVRLQSPNGYRYNITFDRSSRYADFHKHAVTLSMGKADQLDTFRIIDSEDKVLNETTWPQLVSSSGANAPSLRLVTRTPNERHSAIPLALPAAEAQDPQPKVPVVQTPSMGMSTYVAPAIDGKPSTSLEPSKTGSEIKCPSPEQGRPSSSFTSYETDSAHQSDTQTGSPSYGYDESMGFDFHPQWTTALAQRTPQLASTGSRSIGTEGDWSTQDPFVSLAMRNSCNLPEMGVQSWFNNVSPYIPLGKSSDWSYPNGLAPGTKYDGSLVKNMPTNTNDYTRASLAENEEHPSYFQWFSEGADDNALELYSDADSMLSMGPPDDFSNGFSSSPYESLKQGGRIHLKPYATNASRLSSPQFPFVFNTHGTDQGKTETRQVRFAENNDEVSTNDDAEKEAAQKSSASCWTTSPAFFQWRPYNQAQWATIDDRDQSLSKLLVQVQKGLVKELKGNLYNRAFQCSRKDLIVRQKFQLQQLPPSLRDTTPAARAHPLAQEEASTFTTSNQSPEAPITQHLIIPSSRPGDLQRGKDQDASYDASHHAGLTRPVTSSYDAHLMTQMFQLSTKIFSAFVPRFGTSDTHEVCNLYWGAVDCIFRQIQWRRAFHVKSEMGAQFASHIAGRGSAVTRSCGRVVSGDDCRACYLDTSYVSDQSALEHLHTFHGSCGIDAERPHDDPCFAWLHQVTIGHETTDSTKDPTNEAMDMIEDFLAHLSQLSDAINNLQSLASRTGRKSPSNQRSSQLLLPASLIRAFQHILEMYILRSHALSLKNKMVLLSEGASSVSNTSSDARRVSELLRWEKMAYDNVNEHIKTARQKIILADDSSTKMTTLGIEQVGMDFLMCSLVGNIQNQSPTVALPAQSTHSHGSCLELYQAYITRLRFQCYHRPQRKVFLEIYSFEEELLALKGLLAAQHKLLCTFTRLMSVAVGEAYVHFRSTSYALGSTELQRQIAHVEQQGIEIKMLQDKCSGLKEQVKQAIEVIEENHGKAIRVFTIVTLFFLPLSFVSTFLGMNTTDVDGLRWDQSIFWATSLPITAVVLVLAILYGYKGDEISEWFRSKGSGRRWVANEQRRALDRERKAKIPHGRRFSGIIRRPTTDSLGIDI